MLDYGELKFFTSGMDFSSDGDMCFQCVARVGFANLVCRYYHSDEDDHGRCNGYHNPVPENTIFSLNPVHVWAYM
jgi:hypothetical protein